MKVISIGGVVNDGVAYQMWLEQPHSQPALRLEMVETEGDDPRVSRARRQALRMQLHVMVMEQGYSDAQVTALREALLAALDTETTAVALVVADDDGGNERYRYVVAQVADEQPESEGMGLHFVATLTTHGETRWRANTATSAIWNVTASGQTLAVTNGGTLPARPTYTFRPTAERGGDESIWGFRQFFAIRWTSPWERHRYPINVTSRNWDTETLLDDGDLYAGNGEDNIAVLVNGQEVRRWVAGYDSPDTSVWVNLDFAPGAETGLRDTIGAVDTVTEIAANWTIETFPPRGMLLIDDEVFTYTAKDDVRQVFLGAHRAAKGTTAGAHTGGGTNPNTTRIYWLQHEVWLVYGGAGLHQLEDYNGLSYDAYKPVMDLANSTNDIWSFEEFGQEGAEYANRPGTWQRRETPGHWALPGGDPWVNISVARVAAGDSAFYPDYEGLPDHSYWTLREVAYPVGNVSATGTSKMDEAETWDVRVDVNLGSFYQLAIPQPAVIGEFEAFGVSGDLAYTGHAEELRFIQESDGAMQSVLYSLTVAFGSSPVAYRGLPEEIYSMDATLKNLTTGLSITLRTELVLNDEIVVDTEARTVVQASDGANVYYALSRSTKRGEILPLAPGLNTLELTESGLTGMTINVEFEERTYT